MQVMPPKEHRPNTLFFRGHGPVLSFPSPLSDLSTDQLRSTFNKLGCPTCSRRLSPTRMQPPVSVRGTIPTR